MDADHIPEAIRLYGRAVKLRPNWPEGWWHLGTLLFDTQQFQGARDAFAQFTLVEHKQAGPGFAMLGLSEFQLKRYPQALAALEVGIERGLGNNPDFLRNVLYHDGVLQSLLGHSEIALTRLILAANHIAAAHPEAPKEALFADFELLDAFGIAALRMAKLPSEISNEEAPVIRQAGHAQALIALQDRPAAATELKEMLARYPSQPGLHYMYGVSLLKEDPPSAIGEFRREIEISPSHAAARIQLALEFLRTADYEQGFKYAKAAVALAPKDFVARVAYGRLCLELGKIGPAIQELHTAIQLAPGSPDAHFALYRALSRAGRNQEAARERAKFERLKALTDAAK
jgi:tetratricopeptide (TPR) repeat protein